MINLGEFLLTLGIALSALTIAICAILIIGTLIAVVMTAWSIHKDKPGQPGNLFDPRYNARVGVERYRESR